MRKSLVMLVLMTLVAGSFYGLSIPTSGGSGPTGIFDNGASINDQRTEGLDASPGITGPEPAQEMAEFENWPVLVLREGEARPWPYGSSNAPSRGAVNTSTLLYIQEAPKQVHFGDEIKIAGLLLEDNNSDGERNSGDLPIIKEWVDILWADGTEWMQFVSVKTEWDNQEFNMTAGRFSIPPNYDAGATKGNATNPFRLFANISNLAANPVELVITYKGVWTADGARFYNITQGIYDLLVNTKKGKDDDGDAPLRQHNGIDDDNDGFVDDGRPAIPAFNTPELPSLWDNGVDDDGDTIVDDGFPGIRTEGNPEGIDEEILNGRDDDGDGNIDEDTTAFLARRGYEKRLYVEIWHYSALTCDVVGSDLIDVGNTFSIRGTIKDTSFDETVMGVKTLRMFWDGQPKVDIKTRPSLSGYFSEYDLTFKVPIEAQAGPHTVTIEFSPGFNKTNNYFFDPSNATATIYVRRPTSVIFDNVDPNYGYTWVYRGTTIYINGSIVDKYYWERDNVREGPKLKVGGVDYANQYRYTVMWGEAYQPFSKMFPGLFVLDENGTFSVEYELPAGSQPLGPVMVNVKTNFDQLRTHDPLIFYSNSENSTVFKVRARTELEIWIDQNQNDLNDENEQQPNGEPLNTFITRKPFKDPTGKVYDWNWARVRGKLKDLTQSSGAVSIGVSTQDIVFYWGFGKTWQKKLEVTTSSDGKFAFNIPIEQNHALGPVPIRSTFSPEFENNYYDSSTYADFDGMPFSVVSFTSLSLNVTIGVKGKPIQVTGTLLDDRSAGVGNKTVRIYRLDRWDGNYNSLTQTGGLGTFIGTATTTSAGKLLFNDYIIEERMSVGSVWVVGKFDGSIQFPEELGGIRYLPNDAYMPYIANPVKLIITSETIIVLDKVPDVLVRNGEARITGKLLESYRGKQVNRGVAGQSVTAYIKQGEELFKMGVGRTKNDPNLPEFNGYFEIKAQNIPSKLRVGKVEILVEFIPEVGSEGVPLYQPATNSTQAEVWSTTRIKEIFFGPEDIDGDRKPDLYEDRTKDWVFTFQVLEGSTGETSSEPVTFGVVWLNLTMGVYSNTTRAITDIRGRVHFNFTSKFKDTATGNFFRISADREDENLTVEIKFIGKQDFMGSSKVYPCTIRKSEPPVPTKTPWLLILLAILIVLILTGIGLYFFYRYIEKKRRLKALKKIIKKAADQLEAGNPYSYVIFKAYQKMGAHLRRYGFLRRDADTFREFEDAVRTALPIDERNLDSFLDILEEARYSKHLIGEAHKEKALGCLKAVEKSLDTIIMDEEAALRQMEIAEEEYTETEIVDTSRGA